MKLSRINTLLLIAILIINSYIVLAPLIPKVSFWLAEHTSSQYNKLTKQIDNTASSKVDATPEDNRLIIPAMLLNTQIAEGKDESALRNGPWRRPNSSTPDKGGNTVIVAHRFTYKAPKGSFYFLDKLKPGDKIGVFWHGKKYIYSVKTTEVVAPSSISVEAQTSTAQLTLYTCTPLWAPKDRLVVIANLEKTNE